MKTLTKLALALVLAVGVMATFSPVASAHSSHHRHHHNHHRHHHHKHNHHKHNHHKHHHHNRHHHHRNHFSYGFPGHVPSRSVGFVYTPVGIDFLASR